MESPVTETVFFGFEKSSFSTSTKASKTYICNEIMPFRCYNAGRAGS
jgi:hypothetical protein